MSVHVLLIFLIISDKKIKYFGKIPLKVLMECLQYKSHFENSKTFIKKRMVQIEYFAKNSIFCSHQNPSPNDHTISQVLQINLFLTIIS